MRKNILLMIVLFLANAIYGKDMPYSGEIERKAVRSAYELLGVYYPDGLCVSDSIYDLEWYYLSDVDEKTRNELKFKISNDSVRTRPAYSKMLDKMFCREKCGDCDSGCVAMFAKPYKGMIRCEVRPKGMGIDGESDSSAFLFRYDEYGDVYQVNRISDSTLILSRQEMPFSDKATQTAVKSAYEIVKVYYPDTLCVSDSIYDIYWNGPFGLDEITDKELTLLMIKQAQPYERPAFFSEILHMALNGYTCKDCKEGYVVKFGSPYKGMLMCEVWPWHGRVGVSGDNTISYFFFRFDDKGLIYQATKGTYIID
ncbi:MAG: hypothetical protein K2K37_06820 [Muribaculaceae bacterium]|nr:hypothetical protein [Muribaculaceae bacterium]